MKHGNVIQNRTVPTKNVLVFIGCFGIGSSNAKAAYENKNNIRPIFIQRRLYLCTAG